MSVKHTSEVNTSAVYRTGEDGVVPANTQSPVVVYGTWNCGFSSKYPKPVGSSENLEVEVSIASV